MNMKITPYSKEINDYLCPTDIIDFKNESITKLSNELSDSSKDELDYIKRAYEYVRDNISHSADINHNDITCAASEVLQAGHGICFAKSHLLAALLRCKSIPTGFCYQKLILDDETAPILIVHGLNGVYIKEYEKWIRLDARGNKEGVNAQFSIDTEQLAFPIRPEMGEEDIPIVYSEPDAKVLEKLRMYKTRIELWDDLPTELAYGKEIGITEELLVYALLFIEGLTAEEEYRQRLDELFLDNPTNEILLELEWKSDIKDIVAFITNHVPNHTFQKQIFGKILMEKLSPIYYNSKNIKSFASSMYSLWGDLPANLSIHDEEPFFALSYADEPLSYGDEDQTRELYEKMLNYYK